MKPFAEIIESNLSSWCGKSWSWNVIPSFGSLVCVKTKERAIYSIVYNIQTSSSDQNRIVMTYQKTEEELRREQPQIFEFLETKFYCINIAYKEKDELMYQLAPKPPKIHDFIWEIDKEEISQLLNNNQYLHLLFNFNNNYFCLDELILAILKYGFNEGVIDSLYFSKFIKMFSLLTGNDYRRLKLFLQRAKQIINF